MGSYSAHQNFILRVFFPIKRNTECGGSEQKRYDCFRQHGMEIECEFVQGSMLQLMVYGNANF